MEITFTDKNFDQEVLQAGAPVLVDFWASWCGPCQLMGPIIEQLANDFKDQPVKIGKLNVDENSATAQRYNVMSIPTLLFFKNGEMVEQLVGVQSADKLSEMIKKLLS